MKKSSRWTAGAMLVAGLAFTSPAAAQEHVPPNDQTEESQAAAGAVGQDEEPKVLRPEIWDELPQAKGVLTTERSLLPSSLSISRGKRAERPLVDEAELTERRLAMVTEGARFTSHMTHVSPETAPSAEETEQRFQEGEEGSSSLSFWISLVFAAGALGLYFKTRGGAS